MTDIEIDITPPSNKSSEDDPLRKELLWEKREEVQILKWMNEMICKKNKHHKKGMLNKKMFYLFGVPNIVIPLIIGGLNGVVDLSEITLTILMISNSIIAGINTFMNYSKKTQLHFEFETKYNELAVSIEKELAIPKKNRVAADVFLERVEKTYNHLNAYAPT